MIDLIVVLLIAGTVTSFLCGTDQAIVVGQNIMEWWLLAGLAIAFLTPIFRILGIGATLTMFFIRFIRWIFKKCKDLSSHRP